MRFLVVFCHPSEDSFSAALFRLTCEVLRKSGHEVKVIDLYREGFNPTMSREEWDSYLKNTSENILKLKSHVDSLCWANGLVLIFPIWMYGPPAMLKGWLERVWLPSIAFEVAPSKKKIAQGKLKHIRIFSVITSSGSPRWWLWYIGNPAKSMLFKGYKILFHPNCKLKWFQLYDMNHSTSWDRENFLKKVANFFSQIK